MAYETNTLSPETKYGTDTLAGSNGDTAKALGQENVFGPDAKKANKTPDLPVVPFKTCDEYKEYMAGTPDDNKNMKHNPPPKDGMTLAQLGTKSDSEILHIVNEMGATENKSDIRIMYAHGYAFTWDDLSTIAAFKDFKCSNPGERRPKYYSLSLNETEQNNKKASDDPDGFCRLFIEHGTREEKVIKKFTFSPETAAKFDELLGTELPLLERSKVIEAIFDKCISDMLEKKKAGKFGVSYRQTERTDIL